MGEAMADAFAGWAKRQSGELVINPLTGWDAFVPFGMACGLRIHYASSDAELLRGEFQYLPLVLTPAQARELAAVLLRSADRAEQKPGTVGS